MVSKKAAILVHIFDWNLLLQAITTRSVTSEGFIGFGSEKSFTTSNHQNKKRASSELSEISAEETTVKKPSLKKRKFQETKNFVKVENLTTRSSYTDYQRRQQDDEAEELFHQLKCLIPNTLTITLLQTSLALVKAGFSESFYMDDVKQEKPDIKKEPGAFVRNKKNFYTLGRNRHVHKLKFIKKKGLFQTKNLLKFDVV